MMTLVVVLALASFSTFFNILVLATLYSSFKEEVDAILAVLYQARFTFRSHCNV
jgi:hypothetical protein